MRADDPVLAQLVAQVKAGAPLEILGGGTKRFLGGAPIGAPLEMRALCGISNYEPSELVVTARAGTPLAELEAALAEKGQCLPFEPPRLADTGTVGGMVAAGLAGPARISAGSLRDHVLGATLLDGRGDVLSFGGQVMKNVAGYDVSRLLPGSFGILGVILEVSLKVLPCAPAQATLGFEIDEAGALKMLDGWRRLPLPIAASSWHDARLRVRLAGASAAVKAGVSRLGGARVPDEEASSWWQSLRDQTHPFFRIESPGDEPGSGSGGESLWRLSVPLAAGRAGCAASDGSRDAIEGARLIEWGGAQQWIRTRASADAVRAAAASLRGHATCFRSPTRIEAPFTAPDEALLGIHRRLKQAFDPAGIFNRGRLHPSF